MWIEYVSSISRLTTSLFVLCWMRAEFAWRELIFRNVLVLFSRTKMIARLSGTIARSLFLKKNSDIYFWCFFWQQRLPEPSPPGFASRVICIFIFIFGIIDLVPFFGLNGCGTKRYFFLFPKSCLGLSTRLYMAFFPISSKSICLMCFFVSFLGVYWRPLFIVGNSDALHHPKRLRFHFEFLPYHICRP